MVLSCTSVVSHSCHRHFPWLALSRCPDSLEPEKDWRLCTYVKNYPKTSSVKCRIYFPEFGITLTVPTLSSDGPVLELMATLVTEQRCCHRRSSATSQINYLPFAFVWMVPA
ncbi:uncharacterized protein LOC119432404 [Dermacentor silvarum]|uniref:uncharacterized protein LOC119432404 n=1 Tax=Dermacentor silvarum TaxID=543639 RepID=UPI00210079F3|nr:uncharacterized protein LOC119432404 [Dermacentor silvarum]